MKYTKDLNHKRISVRLSEHDVQKVHYMYPDMPISKAIRQCITDHSWCDVHEAVKQKDLARSATEEYQDYSEE